jgi:hypothetical protein
MRNIAELIEIIEVKSTRGSRSKGLQENECGLLYNEKNNTYYVRIGEKQTTKFDHLLLGRLNSSLYLILKKEGGIKASKRVKRATSVEFVNKELVELIIRAFSPESFGKKRILARMDYDVVEETHTELVLKIKNYTEK